MSAIAGYDGPYNPRRPVPDGESRISIYGYYPSLVLAIVALVTFAIVLGTHVFYLARKCGTRIFQSLLAFGCAMELVGFGFRAASHSNPFVIIRFIIQYFMIVVAPVVFAAALYLSLSMAVQRTEAAHLLPLKPKVMVTIFVIIDVITIALQVMGAAFIGVSTSATANNRVPFIQTSSANNILLAGLAVQTSSFLMFQLILVRATVVSRRHKSDLPEKRLENGQDSLQSPIRPLFFLVLGLSSFAIWVRTIFRLAETAEGVFGYASTHEWLFGIMEYTPVIIALTLWAVFPLYKLLPSV